MQEFDVRDLRHKEKFVIDDAYLNGYARKCGAFANAVYLSLCRHADNNQSCFPSYATIAFEHNISRRSVIRAVTILEKFNIIKIVQNKTKERGFINNTYLLVDKKHWSEYTPSDTQSPPLVTHSHHSSDTQSPPLVTDVHSKDTHIKDTHIRISSKEDTQVRYGNEDINFIISYLKEKLQLPMLDDSEKVNRQYANLLLRKFKDKEKIKRLIDITSKDQFWRNSVASTKGLFYNAIKIISKARGGLNVDIRTRGIDATQL